MARINMRTLIVAAAVALCVIGGGVEAKKDKKIYRAVKSDVKYIKCQVCKEVAKVLHRETKKLKEEKGQKLTEHDIIEKVEKVCDPVSEEGEYLMQHDLQEQGKELKMVYMDGKYGQCRAECKTMQKACEDLVADRDTDVGEKLFKGELKRAGMENWLCYEETDACSKKTPKLPKDRKPGEDFIEKEKKEIDMERMMATMKANGMGNMQMFNRDDMDDMLDDYKDDAGDLPEGLGSMGGAEGEAEGGSDGPPRDPDAPPAPSISERLGELGGAIKKGAANAWSSAKSWAQSLFSAGNGGDSSKTTSSTSAKKKKKAKKSKGQSPEL